MGNTQIIHTSVTIHSLEEDHIMYYLENKALSLDYDNFLPFMYINDIHNILYALIVYGNVVPQDIFRKKMNYTKDITLKILLSLFIYDENVYITDIKLLSNLTLYVIFNMMPSKYHMKERLKEIDPTIENRIGNVCVRTFFDKIRSKYMLYK